MNRTSLVCMPPPICKTHARALQEMRERTASPPAPRASRGEQTAPNNSNGMRFEAWDRHGSRAKEDRRMTKERMRYYQPEWSHHATTQRFIFATGIECSYPTIRAGEGRKRVDQMEKCGH